MRDLAKELMVAARLALTAAPEAVGKTTEEARLKVAAAAVRGAAALDRVLCGLLPAGAAPTPPTGFRRRSFRHSRPENRKGSFAESSKREVHETEPVG